MFSLLFAKLSIAYVFKSRLFLFFLLLLTELIFRVLACVCEAQLHLCVQIGLI